MKTIRVAGYKWAKTLFSKLISFKQRVLWWLSKRYARYSHIEIDFWDVAFSSSEYDWWVRFKKIERKADNWDFITIDVDDKMYNKMLKFAKKNEFKSYNWFGIVFAQVLWLNWFRKRDSYFCSEIASKILQLWHISDRICFEDSAFISPWKLMYLLEDGEHVIDNL